MKLILPIAWNESVQASANGELCQKTGQFIRGDDKCRGSASVEKTSPGITATLKR